MGFITIFHHHLGDDFWNFFQLTLKESKSSRCRGWGFEFLQMMNGVFGIHRPPKRQGISRFHVAILSFGEQGSLWIKSICLYLDLLDM